MIEKKILYIFFVLFFGQLKSSAQVVKFIKNSVQAKYRVYISPFSKNATHWIYRVSSPAEIRKPGDWYVVTNPTLFKNAMTLYEVKEKDEADFVVYFVSTRDSARIKN